jgi:hypothetical protein
MNGSLCIWAGETEQAGGGRYRGRKHVEKNVKLE